MRRILICAAALALAGAGQAFAATADVQQVHGHIHSHAVACPSLCTAGTVTGTIHGNFSFVATGFIPSPGSPGVLFYTGTITISSSQGDFTCADNGAFDVVNPAGPFVDLCEATGGTGRWAGASGYIEIFGTFSATAGGDSDYQGAIARP